MSALPLTYAVVPAAGCGVRFGGPVKKQYIPLNRKEVLVRTLEALAASEAITGIIIASSAGEEALVRELCEQHQIAKITAVVTGGETRADSVYAGLKVLPDDCEMVLIHDGVRPFVTDTLILRTLAEAAACGAAIAAIPLSDTVKVTDGRDTITETPDRSMLRSAQTPQAFRREVITLAYDEAAKNGFGKLTDDASAVERYTTCPVHTVPGELTNIKITSPQDLVLARLIAEEFDND